jgi:protein PhnA
MGGYDKHQERRQAVLALGRALARRARSACELCEASSVRLDPVEVTPLAQEPELERTVMLCERCAAAAAAGSGGKGRLEAAAWRFLESAAWNPLAPVQVVAVRVARRLAAADVAWARELVEALYLDEEIRAWIDAG